MGQHSSHGSHDPPAPDQPTEHATVGGLSVATSGLRFDPMETRFSPGEATDWRFRVITPEGSAVTDFEESHGQRGHLIVVRRDLTGFQHLHPTLGADGTWRADGFTLPDPGVYRAFLDIVVGGHATTLGFDLFAAGEMVVAPHPETVRLATADGYDVELLTDGVVAGKAVTLTFEVTRGGVPVSRLDPYLGAAGHLVALREGDLAYLHVHPEAIDPGDGRVEFRATFPTPGRYRLFLQSKPEGTLVTTHHDVHIEG